MGGVSVAAILARRAAMAQRRRAHSRAQSRIGIFFQGDANCLMRDTRYLNRLPSPVSASSCSETARVAAADRLCASRACAVAKTTQTTTGRSNKLRSLLRSINAARMHSPCACAF
eukprot:1255127-Pleurochrysis_carterae.AAC.3